MDMKIGDLCWAKMKGFPPWPGKIIAAPQSAKYRYLHSKKLHHYIYFFGSGNHAWLPATNIKPNSEEAIRQASKKRSVPLQKAIQQLKRDMPKTVSQDLEKKYYRKGIIKPCIIAIKRLRIDSSELKELNSFTLNKFLSLGLRRNESLQPQRKIRKMDNSYSNKNSMEDDTDSKSTKCQEISTKKFGFISRGELGKGIVKNLLKSKCDVTIWNQTSEEYGLNNEQQTADSFSNLIATCDIILCCISCEEKNQSIFFKGDMGILQSFATNQSEGKGFALLDNVDLQVSAEIAASIQASGGRYIGLTLLGSKTQEMNGELLIVCSGDKSLFGDCKAAFTSFKRLIYLGPDIELAPKIHPIIGLFLNSVSKSYKEARSLIQELKLSVQIFDDLLKAVLGESSLALCHDPLEKRFSQQDRVRFFLEDLKLKTLLEANFPPPGSDTQKNSVKELGYRSN